MRVFTLISALAFVLMVPGAVGAADFIYVSLGDSTIRRYDVSLGTAAAVAASAEIFVNTGQGLNNPFGLAFDSSGNLYAANFNNTITRYDSSGTYVSGAPFVNTGQGLNSPLGLAFDSSGNLYAANEGNSTISKIRSDGTVLFSWSTPASPGFLAFVPEPSTYILGTLAALTLAILARRQRRTALA